MDEIKLLIVEDNEKDKEAWDDNVEEFNRSIEKEKLKAGCEFCKSFEDANKRISNDFDAVIIDLRLEGDDKTSLETGGGKLIDEKIDILRLPTFVYTATPGLIEIIEKKETVFFKKYMKDQVLMVDILKEIKKIYDTGITRILGGRGEIEKMLDKIFWRHLSNSFSYWISPPENIDVERVLLRYIVSHLTEYLAINQVGNYEKYLPPETFIIPPIDENIYTGDILKKVNSNDLYYIILNPSCDLVLRENEKEKNKEKSFFRNAGKIVLASLIKWDRLKAPSKNEKSLFRNAGKIVLASLIKWNKLENLSKITKDSNKDDKKKLRNYVSNNKNRYHYLPLYKDIGGMFIDFESIETYEAEKLTVDFERIATISPTFLKNIVSRFSQYYSRQGQPDFDYDSLVNDLIPIQE